MRSPAAVGGRVSGSARRARRGAFALALMAGVGAGCAAPYAAGTGPASTPTADGAPLTLGVDSLFAPVRGDGMAELRSLHRAPPGPLVELRRAVVLLEQGDAGGAHEAVNRVLFGPQPPAIAVEAYARYLRARIGWRLGRDSDADADLAEARRLAVDGDLQLLIERDHPARVEPAAAPTAVAPAVVARQQWDPQPVRRGDLRPMEKPFRITIHHSAIASWTASPRAAASQILSIQRGHQRSEGWADIGYHFLIDRAGRVWEGRSLRWQGAHAGGDNNRGNIGICLLGRFMPGGDGQEPSPEQAAALEGMLRWLCVEHGIPPSAIYFHSRFKNTACPGRRLELVAGAIRARLVRELAPAPESEPRVGINR